MVNKKKLALLISIALACGMIIYSGSWRDAARAPAEARYARFDQAEAEYLEEKGVTKADFLDQFYAQCRARLPACLESAKTKYCANDPFCDVDYLCTCNTKPLIAMPKPTWSSYLAWTGGFVRKLKPLLEDIILALIAAIFLVFVLPKAIRSTVSWVGR